LLLKDIIWIAINCIDLLSLLSSREGNKENKDAYKLKSDKICILLNIKGFVFTKKFKEKIDISINNTTMIIEEIVQIYIQEQTLLVFFRTINRKNKT